MTTTKLPGSIQAVRDLILDAQPSLRSDVMQIDLWYPRLDDAKVRTIQVGLSDVRAADDVRISYDFHRDGWSIAQASTFQWNMDEDPDDDWQEVAFVRAWGREREKDPATDEYITPKGQPSRLQDDAATLAKHVREIGECWAKYESDLDNGAANRGQLREVIRAAIAAVKSR